MLRLCLYHPRATYMKWKNFDVTRVTYRLVERPDRKHP